MSLVSEEIKELAQILKLSYAKGVIEDFLLEAAAENYGVDEAIKTLFARECELRKQNGIKRRLQRARFPYQMNFELFETKHLSADVKREVRMLETLSFIEDKTNTVLIGNPGVGKTALAVAIGTKACERGKTVSFISVPNLVIEMKEAMSLNQLQNYKKSFEKFDLVILDDLGYCSFSKECGEVLFNLLSNRNEKGSMVITTNLTFDRWNEVFDDIVLTGAIVDRIAHKAHCIDMTGDSYRVLDTKEWIKQQQAVN